MRMIVAILLTWISVIFWGAMVRAILEDARDARERRKERRERKMVR